MCIDGISQGDDDDNDNYDDDDDDGVEVADNDDDEDDDGGDGPYVNNACDDKHGELAFLWMNVSLKTSKKHVLHEPVVM